MNIKLTMDKVLEIEAHGLSVTKSAYLLGVHPTTLLKYTVRENIHWRGKKVFTKAGEVNPESYRQKN